MKFEEEFPSLKVIGYPLLIKGTYDMTKDIFGQFVSCAQVQRYTIDKQRVKEALLRYSSYNGTDYLDKVWEELGLEDEK